jgi:hypothetical protein
MNPNQLLQKYLQMLQEKHMQHNDGLIQKQSNKSNQAMLTNCKPSPTCHKVKQSFTYVSMEM